MSKKFEHVFLNFKLFYSIQFWPKFCFLCSCVIEYLVEWQTEQFDLGPHWLHMPFCQQLWHTKILDIYCIHFSTKVLCGSICMFLPSGLKKLREHITFALFIHSFICHTCIQDISESI